MPGVVRIGDMCSGHECFPPRTCTEGSGNVFADGRGIHRKGDAWEDHTCTHKDCPHGTHGGALGIGSSSVFVNGKPCARIGDMVDCGSTCAEGSPDVFAGG